jgi:carbamoyl-phosphate synthase large subunit
VLKVLITSVSKKVPLVHAVRRACEKFGEDYSLYGGDLDPLCIGSYFVDEFWEMPPLDHLKVDELISYCQFHGITRVIPTRDGELIFFAEHRAELSQQGIEVMISSLDGVEIALDKLRFCEVLSGMGISTIETSLDLESLECDRYVVKERYGAGACRVGVNLTNAEAKKHAKKLHHPVFQPCINGQETSVDLYVDTKGLCLGVVLRNRNLVVNGESQITSTFRDEALEERCAMLAQELELTGHGMFQLIHDSENHCDYFLECNPRFGGASTLSLGVGLDSFFWFLCEGAHRKLPPFVRSIEEKTMVRYAEDYIF